jgi:hypothetical protein
MAFEDELMDALSEKQFKRFEDGEYQFTAPNKKIFEAFEVMK